MAKIRPNLTTPPPARTDTASSLPALKATVAPGKTAPVSANSSFQAGVPAAQSPVAVSAPGTTIPPASSLHFDASNPDVQAFAASQGWNTPGTETGIASADLVYTTDNWKTTKSVPLQYLYNNSRGFLIRDVPPGTQVEYAIHAQLYSSHDHFRSADQKADTWFNNGGANFHGVTGDPSGF